MDRHASPGKRTRLESSASLVENQRKSMEDAFFIRQDKEIIENLRKMKAMKETKKAIAEVSGIADDAVLQKLVELNVRPETVASLAVVPLVEVAWADGSVDEEERKAVLKAADKTGLAKGGIEHELLVHWMDHRPPRPMLDAWAHYIRGLCARLTPTERAQLKKEVVGRARSIAEASGGFLGIGNRVSEAEEAMLAKLEHAFG
jgi:hypothetical protein